MPLAHKDVNVFKRCSHERLFFLMDAHVILGEMTRAHNQQEVT